MKKNKIYNIRIIVAIIFIVVLATSLALQIHGPYKKKYDVNKHIYKFYLEQHRGQHDYEEQSALEFPTDGYYLNIDKTNEECPTGAIDQNGDLSVNALIRFSTVCNLYYDLNASLTVTANVSTAVAVIKVNNDVVASGTVPITAGVGNGKNVTITVSEPEYYYTETNGTYNGYEETFVMTTEDTTKNITLNERPWITGTTSNTSSTTAATKTTTNWHAGYYLVEAWGGTGGTGSGAAGAAGYVYGIVYIGYNNSVYSTAGGNGSSSASNPSGGANGGGNGGSGSSGMGGNKGAGGGYSAFAIGATAINSTNINNGTVKLIAGGGGGGAAKGSTFGTGSGGSGGAGGSLTTTKSTITAGSVFSGVDGVVITGTGANSNGKAGSTSAGAGGGGGSNGSMLTGGGGYERGGGGGAGYYGGGGGGISSAMATAPGGGGGGSSFIANGVTYSGLPSSVTNKLTSSNPSSTGGAIKIQWIGKNMP